MSDHRKDDWQKSRSVAQHLTEAEIEKIRLACRADRPAADVARELECSSRTVRKYYLGFRGITRSSPQAKPELQRHYARPSPRPPVDRASRFYRGSFEL